MRKELHRRLGKLAARHDAAGPRLIRLMQVLRPELPYADQERWIGAAEACVLGVLERERVRPVMLWSHVAAPGIVTVDAGRRRFRVDATGDEAIVR